MVEPGCPAGGFLRLVLPVLVCAIAFILPADAVSILPRQEGDLPVGMNAVDNVASFAMAHPARFGDSDLMEEARADLETRLADLGFEVSRHRYGGSNPGTNIVGILRGEERPHDWVVLTAHYDTALVPVNGLVGGTTHGAWDNGAGVAALLEIGRVATQRSWNNTFAVVFLDDEEAGLVGASAFVNAYNGRMWEGAPIRLMANINMDPPGLNWPCLSESGVTMPVTVVQSAPENGVGSTLIRELTFAARVAEGVPDEAFEFFRGGVSIAFVLSGSSDNAMFGTRGIPDVYIGSSTHLNVAARRLDTTYPLHTPADNLGTMLAWCGGDPNVLARAFEVEMRMAWRVLGGLDAAGTLVRP